MHCSFEVDNYACARLEQTACFVPNRDHIISGCAGTGRFLNRVILSQINVTIKNTFFSLVEQIWNIIFV